MMLNTASITVLLTIMIITILMIFMKLVKVIANTKKILAFLHSDQKRQFLFLWIAWTILNGQWFLVNKNHQT